MPPHANLERLIGRALVDGEFRAALLHAPASAAAGFGLSREELRVLEAACASTLEELAGFIHAWTSQLPHARRTASRRWPLDSQQAFRVAV